MKIDDALELYDQGFCVFPLKPNSKIPLISAWDEWAADADRDMVEAMWKKYPHSNIGVATGPSDLLVLDVDNKGKKNGTHSLMELTIFNEVVPTYSVSTPSGGEHHYFKREGREARNSVEKLGAGLDTRALGGYVVGKGSIIDDGKYEQISKRDVSVAPDWLYPEQVEVVQKEEVAATDLDLERAKDWIAKEAPESIEGEGGDSTLFTVACWLRDMGLDSEQAFDCLLQYNESKCHPEWEVTDLQSKLTNAYAYAQNSKGSKALPQFEDLSSLAPVEQKEVPRIKTFSGADLDLQIPPRDWIVPRRLLVGFVTTTVAPGGTGKSSHAMMEAVSIATGRPLLGEVPKKTGAVVIYNVEDPLDELQRRLCAIALHFEIPFAELKDVHLVSGLDHPLSVASTKDGVTGATQGFTQLVNLVKDTKALLLVLDPFIQTHSVDENSNNAIGVVARLFSQLATKLKCAVNIVHHTRKMPAGSGAGEMDNARGASALVSATRIATTMTTMSESDAEKLQVPKMDRGWYVRVDNAKGNMQPPASAAEWFRKVSVTLPNGDEVGVLEPQEFDIVNERDQMLHRANLLAEELFQEFGVAEVPMAEVMKFCMKNTFEGASERTVRRQIEEFYAEPVEHLGIKIGHRHFVPDGAQRARHTLLIEQLKQIESAEE
jgi:hypothetical protein